MKGSSLDQCKRYASIADANTTTTTSTSVFDVVATEQKDTAVCTVNDFNRDQIETCPTDNFIFRDKEVTISNEVSNNTSFSGYVGHSVA